MIDAHNHFWQYDPGQYAWIGEGMKALQRDFLPEHLAVLQEPLGVTKTVAVQARQSLEETRWLLELAEKDSRVAGVVGWADLQAPDLSATVEGFKANGAFKGLRHIVQDEPDDNFLLKDQVQRGLSVLADLDVSYDVLIFPRQIPAALETVKRHPRLRLVLDHLAKPSIRDGKGLKEWAQGLRALGEQKHLCCKLSGMVTEADWAHWNSDDFAFAVETAWQAFGPERLMFGSDWPVCLLAADYGDVFDLATDHLKRLGATSAERQAVMGENAARFYQLD